MVQVYKHIVGSHALKVKQQNVTIKLQQSKSDKGCKLKVDINFWLIITREHNAKIFKGTKF